MFLQLNHKLLGKFQIIKVICLIRFVHLLVAKESVASKYNQLYLCVTIRNIVTKFDSNSSYVL